MVFCARHPNCSTFLHSRQSQPPGQLALQPFPSPSHANTQPDTPHASLDDHHLPWPTCEPNCSLPAHVMVACRSSTPRLPFLFPCKATLACTCTATCFQPTCQTHRQPRFRPRQLPAHQTPTRASLPHACRSHPLPVHPTPGCLPYQPTCSRPTETYATNLKISFPMQDHVHVECISRW